MKNRSLAVVALGLGILFASATSHAAPARRANHVFIISFDQGNPAGIQKAEMPVFKKMASSGAHTWQAYTIVPSITLPSHTSMLTGVGIQKHQILWNDYQPKKGVVQVPTIFSVAKPLKATTAMFVAKEKFRHLELPGSVDRFVYPDDHTAKGVAQAFAESMKTLKPNLCFIHFGDPDVKGHEFGMESPEKMQAFADTDQALNIIRQSIKAAGIEANSVIIMTADHGGHDVKDRQGNTRGTHGEATPDDVTIPWVAWGKGVKPNFTITAPVVQYDTAATALWLLGIPIPEGFWGRPVTSAFAP
jgi:predicted AlkP superfamily pyrophosphatase or phosphodiesterase